MHPIKNHAKSKLLFLTLAHTATSQGRYYVVARGGEGGAVYCCLDFLYSVPLTRAL